MNRKELLNGILITLLLGSLLFVVGFSNRKNNYTQKLYQVYLSGEKIGMITDEKELYDLIDKEQKELKEKYKVDKIYPPNGLDVSPVYTYNKKVNSVEQIYEYIKDKDPFTIEGYEVTIKKDTPIVIYLLDEKDLDTAIRNTVEAFLDEEKLEQYLNKTQPEIIDEGTSIDRLYLQEEISIKKTFISTENQIFTDAKELSRYMLFGTLETQATYTTQLDDTVESVAEKNKMSVDEFLIINSPKIVSKDALLYPGQVINVGLMNPLVNVVVETTLVENQVIKYETTIEYDTALTVGSKYVKQEGVNGLTKASFKVQSINGQIMSTVPLKNEQITPAVDQIIVMGGKNINYVGDSTYWAWPTLKPYVISSRFGWRNLFGKREFHKGLDITGTGLGSPIFAIQNGEVIQAGYNGSMGNYIIINHNNGYYSIYMHLSEILDDIKQGATVTKGQSIGLMGSTGRSTGTHLHLGISINGAPFVGEFINPELIYK